MFDAYSAGEQAYALELSREFTRDHPDFDLGWLLHGIILCELARYDESERALHAAIETLQAEHLNHGYFQLGHLYRD